MISDSLLLHCIRSAVQKAGNTTAPNEQHSLLAAADQILNLVLLNQDRTFYIDYYASGYQLARRGHELLGNDANTISLTSHPESLDADMATEIIAGKIDAVSQVLQSIVCLLPQTGDKTITAYLNKVTDWEPSLYARRLEPAGEPDQDIVAEITIGKEDFEEYLRRKFPQWEDLKLTKFARIPGGFSKVTTLFETQDKVNGHRSMVIRAMQSTHIIELHAGDIVNEYPIVKLAYDAGLPVAEPLWLEDNKDLLGTTFMVSEQKTGEILGTAVGPTRPISKVLLRNLVKTLVQTHDVDLDKYQEIIQSGVLKKWYENETIADYNRYHIEYWRNLAVEFGAFSSPLMARAFRWLEDNIDECKEKPVLVHGDYGLHNILIENDAVSAMLDWEICHLGGPRAGTIVDLLMHGEMH